MDIDGELGHARLIGDSGVLVVLPPGGAPDPTPAPPDARPIRRADRTDEDDTVGTLLQVNIGRAQPVPIGDRMEPTAIIKSPVDGPVTLADDHVAGDVQADRRHHGGRDQAVYAYDRDSYDAWEAELGRDLPNGFFGENLTLAGIDVDTARLGEQWRIGDDVVLAVTSPRIPCWKLGWRMQDPSFVGTFLHGDRSGAYLRIVTAGAVAAGDVVEVVARPDHDVTVTDVLALWRGEDVGAHVLTAGDHLGVEARDRARGRPDT